MGHMCQVMVRRVSLPTQGCIFMSVHTYTQTHAYKECSVRYCHPLPIPTAILASLKTIHLFKFCCNENFRLKINPVITLLYTWTKTDFIDCLVKTFPRCRTQGAQLSIWLDEPWVVITGPKLSWSKDQNVSISPVLTVLSMTCDSWWFCPLYLYAQDNSANISSIYIKDKSVWRLELLTRLCFLIQNLGCARGVSFYILVKTPKSRTYGLQYIDFDWF